jgi:hypothetical protein
MPSAKHRRGATDRTAAQDKDNRNRIGSRVWLHLDGEKRTTGILLSAAEIGVVIREDNNVGVVVLRGVLREIGGGLRRRQTLD